MIAGGVASPFEAISSSVANNSESDMYGDISRVREGKGSRTCSFLAVFCLWIILRGQALSRSRKVEDLEPRT
jgi:hypothetical protein